LVFIIPSIKGVGQGARGYLFAVGATADHREASRRPLAED
jgi:hypothetical protein